MKRILLLLALFATLAAATPVDAQVIGLFKWRTAPFCNVINVTVTKVGPVFTLDGFEEQCGGNPRLPVSGIAIVQQSGQIWMGLTTIMPLGNGLHTNTTIAADTFSGTWRDNANQSGAFIFGAGPISGGPRINPLVPDVTGVSPAADDSSRVRALEAEVRDLKRLIAEILARTP